MKVAFATTDGRHIDEHFGRAGRFVILEFTRSGYTALPDLVFAEGRDATVESTRGRGDAHDEAIERKIERLDDCRLVYLTAIGGPSAARLARKGIMPVKVAEGSPIEEAAVKLMTTIRTAPPPWMRRALATNTNHEGEDR